MAQNLDDVSRLLGNIESSVKSLAAQLARNETAYNHHIESIAKRQDAHEDTSRALLGAMTAAEQRLKVIESQISSEIKPVTDDVKKWRLMGLGALGATGIAAAALGSTISEMVQKLLHSLKVF